MNDSSNDLYKSRDGNFGANVSRGDEMNGQINRQEVVRGSTLMGSGEGSVQKSLGSSFLPELFIKSTSSRIYTVCFILEASGSSDEFWTVSICSFKILFAIS